MNLIDEMANEALGDNYFIELFSLAEKVYWQHILEIPSWKMLKLVCSQASPATLSFNTFQRELWFG